MRSIHQRPTRRDMLALAGAAVLWPATGRATPIERLSGRAFGTDWQVAAPEGNGLGRLRPAIEALFAEVDRQMSPWRADSAISRFNAGNANLRGVPDDLFQVTAAALSVARLSGGMFDPTVGPLVSRWGFGPITGAGEADWHGIRLGNGTLGKTRADATLDLCGIAKGWALDRATALLSEAGIGAALFDLGGELAALGAHPSGRDWQVAVEHPLAGGAAPAVLRLPAGRAVATSGMQNKHYRLGGRVYSHIIDPNARGPVIGSLRSVTVLSEDATNADGWATALFAAGERRGPELAGDLDIAALFLIEAEGSLIRQTSGGMEAYLL
jgi:thiamine biosynthesis lipoprotein